MTTLDGRTARPSQILIDGLRKAVKDDATEWVDANIIRLLLDRFDAVSTPAEPAPLDDP